MVFVVAFLIFAALSAATWYLSVACFKATYGDNSGPAVRGVRPFRPAPSGPSR